MRSTVLYRTVLYPERSTVPYLDYRTVVSMLLVGYGQGYGVFEK